MAKNKVSESLRGLIKDLIVDFGTKVNNMVLVYTQVERLVKKCMVNGHKEVDNNGLKKTQC